MFASDPISATEAHSRCYSGGDADHTDAGLWFAGAGADTEDSRRGGRGGPIRPDRHFLPSPGNGWGWGAGSTNHSATYPQSEHLLSLLSSLLDCSRCFPLHWWFDPNTERELRQGSEGQAGGSAGYDLAKACTAFDVAATHHTHNAHFAFWVFTSRPRVCTPINVLGRVRMRYRGG